jgi:hypothetical protein
MMERAVVPEKILTLHLALETGDVSVAEILAELLHLLQLQQVDPQHLDRSDHLKIEGALLGDNTSTWIRSTWIAPII